MTTSKVVKRLYARHATPLRRSSVERTHFKATQREFQWITHAREKEAHENPGAVADFNGGFFRL